MSASILDRAYARSAILASVDLAHAVQLKQAGSLPIVASVDASGFGTMQNQSANRARYALFRGWVYAAIHALAKEAAGQAVNVARIKGAEPREEEERRILSEQKHFLLQRMPPSLRTKIADQELEILIDHPLIDVLDQPNPVQTRWQFVYTFVANLNLTGRAYLIMNDNKATGKLEVWCLPTTWVIPDHTDGPFSKFRIVNPKDAGAAADAKPIDKANVGMAYLPDPSNPLGAMPPALAQLNALRIDDHIQTSQERFFENGIFPSMIVKIGAKPLGEHGPIRPTLTGPQRRQIHGAISKTVQGIANYGNFAIVDGMIESFERMSATQNEMGWEKSEGTNSTRILSAFGVHPLILGEPLNVGGYLQSTVSKGIISDSVNVFLDMLTQVANGLFVPVMELEDRLRVWWELCKVVDPSIFSKEFIAARKVGDVTRNENRARLGLPPDETAVEGRSKLLDSPQVLSAIFQSFAALANGLATADQVAGVLALFLELPIEEVKLIVGTGEERPVGEVVESLQAAVRAMKEPLKVELGHVGIDATLAKALAISEEAKKMAHEAGEKARDANVKAASDRALKEATQTINNSIEQASSKFELVVVKQASEEGKTAMMQDVLAEMGKGIEAGMQTIQKAADQPIEVTVTNEVKTPEVTVNVEAPNVEVTNEVGVPEVTVNNEV